MAYIVRMNTPRLDLRAMIAACEAVPMRRSQIARETGLSRTIITRIANGERGRAPSFDTASRVAQLHARLLPIGNK